MPEISISIQCDPYLRQWFINNSGGVSPVRLRKNSPEQHLLRVLLAPKSSRLESPSQSEAESSENLRVVIPYFKGMPPDIYNHLSDAGQKAFLDILRKRFDLQLFQDLAPVLPHTERRDDLIYAWMEANGIEQTETNWCAVEKRLRRLLDRLNTKIRIRNFRKKSL